MESYKNYMSFYFILILTFCFHTAMSQTGIRNNGAIIRSGQDTYIKVSGSGANFVNNTANSTEPAIDMDGTLIIEGDWINNSASNVFVNRNATGAVLFNGSAQQTIGGTNPTTFENLQLNNTSGLVLNASASVEAGLILSSGLFDIGSNNLTIGSAAGISGTFSASNMIVADGGGELIKSVTTNGSFLFPVGDNTSTAEYSPVSLTLNSNSGLSSAWIGVQLEDNKHPSDTSISEFLTRYWTVNAGGITGPDYDVTFNYVDDDVTGNEADIFNAKYDGGTSTVYGRVDASNNQVSFSNLASFSDFAGIAGLVSVIPASSGTWADQVGTTYSYTDVTIPDGITIHLQSTKASASVKNLYVESTGNLSVDGLLNITGNLHVFSDTSGTGSLIDKGSLTIDGEGYIRRYLATNSTDNNWRYITSPVDTALSGVVDPESAGSHMFWWDEINDAYQEITTNTDTMHQLLGYAVASSSARTLAFAGKPNTGIQDRTVTRTSGNSYEGFNLVGNPYPSTVNWDTTTWNNSNLQPTIWYRTDGNFATYNKDTDVGANNGQPLIPAMQGFWVRVVDGQSSGTYEVNNDVRSHERYGFYKKKNGQRQNIFRIEAEKNGYTDEAVITFMSEAANSYDNYDSDKMFTSYTNYPQLYMEVDGKDVVINSLNSGGDQFEIPLGFKAMEEGEVTLTATNIGEFNPEFSVKLEDKFENVTTDFRENTEYTFTSEVTDTLDRFVLHFNKGATSIPGSDEESGLSIYSFRDKVYLKVNDKAYTGTMSDISIYNVLGQEVYQEKTQLAKGENLITPDLKSGYYIVKLKNGANSKSQRIYLEK